MEMKNPILVCEIKLPNSICLCILLFQSWHYKLLSFLDDDSKYIKEDREEEIARTNKAARRIQQSIMKELQTTIRGAQVLPEDAAKDLILQVGTLYMFSEKDNALLYFLWNPRVP